MGESAFLSPMLYFSCFANKQSIHFLLHLRKIGFRISARFDIFMIRRPRPVRKVFHQFMLYGVIMDIIHMTLQIFPVADLSYWNIEREINIRMGKLKGKFTHPTGWTVVFNVSFFCFQIALLLEALVLRGGIIPKCLKIFK